jgi:dTDP-glucose 4,6-dehydratase
MNLSNKKKIIITGGCGFIGSSLIEFLLKKNFKILNLDKLTYSANKDINTIFKCYSNYSFIKTDINNSILLKNIFKKFKPDAVFHLAAESHVDRSIKNSENFIKTNILGTYSLLQISLNYYNKLKNKKFIFIHVSTDEVYGDLNNSKRSFKETTPYNPSSPYSASKASSDHLVKSWGRTFNLPIIVTNCSNNYGPYQFPEKLIPHTILSALNKKKIPIYGNGKQERDWLYVGDHVEALYKILLKGKINNSYNIGSGTTFKNLEIVKKICKILTFNCNHQKNFDYAKLITHVKDRPGHDKKYLINYSKMKKQLNWRPKTNLNDGLRYTIQWYLNNKAKSFNI